MTTKKFKDVIQCIDGSNKGLIAQVISVNNGDVQMFHRSFDSTPTFFKITEDESVSYWRPVGVAVIGPKPKLFESESAQRPTERPEDSSPSPGAAPAQSPTAPLKIAELLEPLPPGVKAVPMNDAAPPTPPTPAPLDWGIEEPIKEENARKSYTALVTNGAGDQATVSFTMRQDLDPKRYPGPVILKAIRVLPNVKPFTVSDIIEVA